MLSADDARQGSRAARTVSNYPDSAVATTEWKRWTVDAWLIVDVDPRTDPTSHKHLHPTGSCRHLECHYSNVLNTVRPKRRHDAFFVHTHTHVVAMFYLLGIIEITLMHDASIDHLQIVRLFHSVLIDTIGCILKRERERTRVQRRRDV